MDRYMKEKIDRVLPLVHFKEFKNNVDFIICHLVVNGLEREDVKEYLKNKIDNY